MLHNIDNLLSMLRHLGLNVVRKRLFTMPTRFASKKCLDDYSKDFFGQLPIEIMTHV